MMPKQKMTVISKLKVENRSLPSSQRTKALSPSAEHSQSNFYIVEPIVSERYSPKGTTIIEQRVSRGFKAIPQAQDPRNITHARPSPRFEVKKHLLEQ